MKKSWLRVLSTAVLAGVLLAGTALPVWASDELVTSELRVKAGSTSAFINGKKQNITKPLVIQGVTMVPVGVFKKAFGSEIVLEKNDVIKIKQGPHVAALTINSPIAWIDGIKVEMDAAPKMVNGVLMVPLRPVATGIGATIAPNSSGEIVIRLLQTGEGTDDGGIDLDKGKTRIGNSYYGWSIHYPADLLVLQSSEQERMMTFGAADESYYLEVYVSDQNVALDADDLLTQLVQVAKQSGDTILDREAVAAKNKPYARVVVKDMDGLLWELRQYVHDGRQYDVYLADYEATNYKDLGKHASLLNSFEPSYAQSDRTIKDLSTVEDGMRAVWNEDYGIGLKVPAGWSIDNKNMVYEGEDGAYLQLRVTSAKAGATVKDWSDQLHKWMSDTFTPESYEQVGSFKTELYGETAEVNEFRYNFGAGWQTEFDVLLQKNGNRYYVEYTFPEEQKDDRAWFERIMKSIEIEFDMVEDNFGQLDEDPYLTDKTKTITRTSKRYHYSVDIPRYWTPYSDKFESSPVIYTFTGGELSIAATEDKSIEMTVSQLREAYAEAAKTRKSFNLIRSEELTFAGVSAFSFTYHESDKGVPYTGRQIVFEKNGTTYTITTGLNDANRTQVQADMLEKAVNSFTFIK